MTHRSRSGGPQRKKPGAKKKGPKLHHPPSKPADAPAPRRSSISDSEGDDNDAANDGGVPSATWFRSSPSDADVLSVLHSALRTSLDAPDFAAQVQRVKALLYDRRWLELFTDPALLDAYAGRWVPPRALCFRDLMVGLSDVRGVFAPHSTAKDGAGGDDSDDEGSDDAGDTGDANEEEESLGDEARAGHSADSAPLHVLSLGGGAGSELLAIAALAARGGARVRWTGVDIGAWGDVLDRIEAAARDKWDLEGSEFVFVEGDLLAPAPSGTDNADARAVPSSTTTTTTTNDDGHTSAAYPAAAFAPFPALATVSAPHITTLFFTLTELLAQSRARTVSLLRALTAATPRGGLLLVADSASDIAEFPLGADGRTWPVYMVLDAIIAAISKQEAARPSASEAENAGDSTKKDTKGDATAASAAGWQRVRASDSHWFRLDPALTWPCKLENARYWMRLYRRV